MQKRYKDLLRALVRDLRQKLVGTISPIDGKRERGNLDRELERLGIAPDGTIKPIDALPLVRPHERYAYRVAVAQLASLPMSQRPAVRGEIIESAAYTWINRLLALRAMEVRGLIDNTLRSDETYGGISEKLFLLRDMQPERATGEDGGWWAVIEDACNERAQGLLGLFSLDDPATALRPSDGVLIQCITLVGGDQSDFTSEESDATFADPDAIGWAYQFYQEENKALIYAKLANGGKASTRAEIAAATQLFTEPYMVQWLLQNSLGRSYHEAYPQSTLPQNWAYYVKPEKLDTFTYFALTGLTLLDPCMGSGHFLRAAFDMFVDMYREQFPSWSAKDIADRILTHHLYGIDLDPRAAQLAAVTLYLRAWELIRDERKQQYLQDPGNYTPPVMNLATTPTNLNKGALERHLQRHPEDSQFKPLIEEIFAGLEQAEILGSLLRPREYLDNAITAFQKLPAIQRSLFDADMDELRIRIAELASRDPDELKKLALQRVSDSFRAEMGNTDDVSAMLFGREAEQGIKLLQLLDQDYAIVATNPPYMGSKNMDEPLRKYIERYYSAGKRDLYAAFILRCLELCKPDGRVVLVTMQNWLFLRSFVALRTIEDQKVENYKFAGILRKTSIEALAHLGRYAFSEIGNAVVAPILFTLKFVVPSPQHKLWACRLTAPRPSEEQANLLKKSTEEGITEILYFPRQSEFLKLDGTPIIYWLRDKFIQLLASPTHYKDNAEVLEGLHIPYNTIYLRFVWEVTSLARWVPFFKGGGYAKWVGFDNYCVEWEYNGQRIKQWPKAIIPSEYRYFQPGLTYGLMALGSLSARIMEKGIFSAAGFAIFNNHKYHRFTHAAYLNSYLCSYLLRCLNPSLRFNKGVVERLPEIPPLAETTTSLVEYSVSIKQFIYSQNPTSRSFINNLINQLDNICQAQVSCKKFSTSACAILHTIEGIINTLIVNLFNLSHFELEEMQAEVGTPAGWYPFITGYDTLPMLPDDLDLPPLPQEVFDYLTNHKRVSPDDKEFTRITTNLRALYEAGPGAEDVEQEESEEMDENGRGNEEIVSGAHIPIPTETFLEELSVKMQLHPITIYWLLEDLRAEGVRCKPEEQRLLEDRLSVLVLRLLGHRWPQQIEANESIPAWAERNGIIPLVNGTGKTMLVERLRDRLHEEDGAIGTQQTEALLEELTGLNLEEWLRSRFFVRHVSQFKYRPVAWHLASTPVKTTGKGKKSRGGSLQRKPAFECLLYYHDCTTNVLVRVRNEYIEPLLQIERSKIEHSRIEASKEQPSGDDTASAIASECIRELEEFAEKLRTIEERGFACDELQKLLTNEPLDRWCGDGYIAPASQEELLREEQAWLVDINDGVRVNIAPLQLAGVLASDVLKPVDARKAIAERARWRSDERHWVREGKLPRCGWMDEQVPASQKWDELEPQRLAEQHKLEQKRLQLQQGTSVDDANVLEEEEVLP